MKSISHKVRAGALTLAITSLVGVLSPSAAKAYTLSQTNWAGSVQVPIAWGYDSANFGNRWIYFPARYAWRSTAYQASTQYIRVDYYVYMDNPYVQGGIEEVAHGFATREARPGSGPILLPEYWGGPMKKLLDRTASTYSVAVTVSWSTQSGTFASLAVGYEQSELRCARVTYYNGMAPSCWTDPSGAILMR